MSGMTHPADGDRAVPAADLGLLPAPRSVRTGSGRLPLPAGATLAAGPGTEGVAAWLRAQLSPATGLTLPPAAADEARLRLRIDPELPAEGYRLTVDAAAALQGQALQELQPEEAEADLP